MVFRDRGSIVMDLRHFCYLILYKLPGVGFVVSTYMGTRYHESSLLRHKQTCMQSVWFSWLFEVIPDDLVGSHFEATPHPHTPTPHPTHPHTYTHTHFQHAGDLFGPQIWQNLSFYSDLVGSHVEYLFIFVIDFLSSLLFTFLCVITYYGWPFVSELDTLSAT